MPRYGLEVDAPALGRLDPAAGYDPRMPMYEYRCRACGETFEALRSQGEADAPVACCRGHEDTIRLLSLVARPAGTSEPAASGGGACCAAGCACGKN
ncbi:MAG: FmdB family zinc ribbon protein [Nitriliruptorales bacterium]